MMIARINHHGLACVLPRQAIGVRTRHGRHKDAATRFLQPQHANIIIE